MPTKLPPPKFCRPGEYLHRVVLDIDDIEVIEDGGLAVNTLVVAGLDDVEGALGEGGWGGQGLPDGAGGGWGLAGGGGWGEGDGLGFGGFGVGDAGGDSQTTCFQSLMLQLIHNINPKEPRRPILLPTQKLLIKVTIQHRQETRQTRTAQIQLTQRFLPISNLFRIGYQLQLIH